MSLERSMEYHALMLTVITALYCNSCVIREKIKQYESMHFLPCLRIITFACSEAASKNSWRERERERERERGRVLTKISSE
ncbi:hypothetical protein EUGRSUZ_L03734 [Eucalyptus grandis]|uniref:Uncharacterized protein n=1 Tax=Eucalyptus grandis TaxID=71139 RepID=A0AAD9T8A1_EUCGR|nr:hypothetical protein EUGRSUZ_L03734 [Eucalyptus grandis]